MRIPYGFTLTNNGTLEINRSDADHESEHLVECLPFQSRP